MKEYIKDFLDYDFDKETTIRIFKETIVNEHNEEVEVGVKRHISKLDTSKPLISPSRLLSFVAPIPPFIFTQSKVRSAQEFGKELGKALESIINHKEPFKTKKVLLKTIITNLFNELKTRQYKPLVCEKHIVYECFHGYIDMLCIDKDDNLVVLELKTRNDIKEIKNKDRFQVSFYTKLISNWLYERQHSYELNEQVTITPYVVVCDRDIGNVQFYNVENEEVENFASILDNIIKIGKI